MGNRAQMVSLSAFGLHQRVFRREDRPLLCVARLLYVHASACVGRWHCLLHVLMDDYRFKSSESRYMLRKTGRENVSALRSAVRLLGFERDMHARTNHVPI